MKYYIYIRSGTFACFVQICNQRLAMRQNVGVQRTSVHEIPPQILLEK